MNEYIPRPRTSKRRLLPTFVGQPVAFLFCGGTSTALHWGVLFLLIHWGVNPVVATACGAVAGSILNYFLQYHWTFNGAGAHGSAIPAYVAVVLLGWVVNATIFYLLVSHVGLAYMWAQAGATALVTAMNFILYKKVVFNERHGRGLAP